MLAGRRDEPHLQLAGAPALADHEVAQQAALRRAGPTRSGPARGTRRAPARAPRSSARRRAGSRPSARSRPSGRARGSRTRARRPGRCRTSTRACCGSATARRRARSARARSRSSLPIRSQRLAHLLALTSSWRSYGSTCHGAPGWSARGGIRSGDGSSISTARASAYARLALPTTARTRSPGTRAGDEHDVAVAARDAVAAVGERVDRQLELVTARRAGAARRWWTPLRMTAVYGQLALDRREHRLAVRVAALVVAHRAQLARREAVELRSMTWAAVRSS